MKCGNCGSLNEYSNKYCVSCGSHLEVEVLNIYDECENQNKNLLYESVAVNEDFLNDSLLQTLLENFIGVYYMDFLFQLYFLEVYIFFIVNFIVYLFFIMDLIF